MKKIITITFAAAFLAACNDNNADNATVDRDSISTMDQTTTTTTTSTTYTPVDGDVTYKEKKVMVMRNGAWVDADDDVRMDNGVVVYRTGKVRKDGNEIELKEGEVVNRTGEFFDETGRAIENAWDATKEGVKDAGKALKKTTKKAGEKVEDAVDNDKKQ